MGLEMEMGAGSETESCWGSRRRVEAVVKTLARLQGRGESLAEVAHDARNMVTALGLYCDLLEEPGVLGAPFAHYGEELRLVAAASRRLVEKLVTLDAQGRCEENLPPGSGAAERRPARRLLGAWSEGPGRWGGIPPVPIGNLAEEVMANRSLLAALAGPGIAVTAETTGGALPVRVTAEDLTRVLVNLVKNAAEAMPAGGSIRIALQETPSGDGLEEWLRLTVEDSGPGIPEEALETIFASGYTTRDGEMAPNGGWTVAHRGLGLAISRAIVEGAGGRILAARGVQNGARIEIELPVRKSCS